MNKQRRQIPKYNELPYLDYGQIFTASSIMYDTNKGQELSTFDVSIREMPGNKNFVLLGGVEDAVQTILNWKYEAKFVNYLLKEGYISKLFAKYLKKYKFKGDLWAIPEGTPVFAGEPVIRITTSFIDANLFTAFLVNVISYPTLFLTKAACVRLACNGKMFSTAGAMRTPGFENILKLQRLSYICGSIAIIPFVKMHFNITQGKPAVGFYHAIIKSFSDEKSAYRHFLPYIEKMGFSTSMVDTYNIDSGIDNWIEVEKEARKEGKTLGFVSIDSGDVYDVSVFLRNKLDRAGLSDVKIVAYSNLNEYKINELEKRGAKIDVYVAMTEVVTVSDRPVLEAVFKLSQSIDKEGKVIYAAKLTPGKMSLPGNKQVFRVYSDDGKIKHDVIGLENEALGQKLMIQYIKLGKLWTRLPSIEELKDYITMQLDLLPDKLKDLNRKVDFTVLVSQQISVILEKLKEEHIKNNN